MSPRRVGVLVSGSGTNLAALLDAERDGRLAPGEIACVISNRPGVRALERAAAAGKPAVVVDHKQFAGREPFEDALCAELARHEVEAIVLAGFMRVLTPRFLDRFPERVINIHPSLLPAFPGGHAIRDAFEAGVKETGCTVHFVIPAVDAGPVIAQARVSVESGETLDSLEAKIHRAEHALLTSVVKEFMAGKVEVPLSLRPS